jgi:hypothetical protein
MAAAVGQLGQPLTAPGSGGVGAELQCLICYGARTSRGQRAAQGLLIIALCSRASGVLTSVLHTLAS